MKKIFSLLLIGTLCLILVGCIKKEEGQTDAFKFKSEYEALNKTLNSNEVEYSSVNISKENPIIYANYNKVFEILEATGIIYFGFPECPWCRNSVPVMLEVAEELGINEIYYMNNLKDRDIRKLENNEVIVEKEPTDDYANLLNKLGEFSSIYSGLNDSSIKRLYFPTVVVVKDGKILKSIVGTVDSQKDPYVSLTSEQIEELKNIYKESFKEVKNNTCNTDSNC